ncbi:hypothetical protein DPMN_140725 [Dreissena polymorpha]|uniref:Uncharacterized protein n=1 Tax=Dreissena polymorpha TaxID=45954 RepID=A0A9D4GE19_DREPO|nr:hypothetical protein DPMN_140725 [Dreissena polymorpha]
MFDVTGHDSLVSVHSSILENLTISGVCKIEEQLRVSVPPLTVPEWSTPRHPQWAPLPLTPADVTCLLGNHLSKLRIRQQQVTHIETYISAS